MSSAGEREPLLSSATDGNLEDQSKKRYEEGSVWARLLAYSVAGFLFIFAFGLVFFPRTSLRRDLARLHNNWLPQSELERLVFQSIKPEELREWSKNYTRKAHLAGDGKDLADWTNDMFTEYGFKSEVSPYYIYLNTPEDNGLNLLHVNGSVKYKAALHEDVLKEDPTSGNKDSVPVFHGYSASGNVTAKFVYANFGRVEDFAALVKRGIEIEGKIVIVRYEMVFRGLKVKLAQEHGAVGVVIFTDPTLDGGMDIQHGYKPYPDGPARHPSSVQRGSVNFLSYGPGDPTTPGYASTIDAERQDPDPFVPHIPSIPISYEDAVPILKALNGHGPGPEDFEEGDWDGILEGVNYNVGPSELELNLFNQQNYSIKPIYNVVGRMEGILPEEAIIVGNHRDSWIAGGSSDPNSGSAALLALAKALGHLKSKGWRPLRTIILASWDGEEYALLGSTEYGEDKAKYLSKNVLAYVNVDVAVAGSQFTAGASPSLNSLVQSVTKRIDYPKGGSLHKHWKESSGATIATLGTGSDYTVFLDHLGIPSVDMGFYKGPEDPVYMYHSNYDSFHWMDTFCDPEWKIHATAAKVLSLLTLTLSERAVADLHFEEYGSVLMTGLEEILNVEYEMDTKTDLGISAQRSIQELNNTIQAFTEAGRKMDEYSDDLNDQFTRDWPWYKYYKKIALLFKIHAVNFKLLYLERVFLYEDGLDKRPWYKHVLFAPDRYLGYGGAVFPGILESIQDNDMENLIKWAVVSKQVLDKAISALKI